MRTQTQVQVEGVEMNYKEDKNMPVKKDITIENIYKMVVDLKRDVTIIKKGLTAEPELRDEFILRMRDIESEQTIMVKDFSERYGLK